MKATISVFSSFYRLKSSTKGTCTCGYKENAHFYADRHEPRLGLGDDLFLIPGKTCTLLPTFSTPVSAPEVMHVGWTEHPTPSP